MRVLIAGGGIGGMTAALCCLHFGHDVVLFEQAAELGEVGAGLQIPPNAMKVFNALGIEDLIAKNAFRPAAIEARMGKSGRHIFTIPLAQQAIDMWGAPYLHIHRADYISALETALRAKSKNVLQLGANVLGYQQDNQGVTVRLKDGRAVKGDILIGADGINSVIRKQMPGPDTAVFTGNMAWRAVVPLDALGDLAPNPTACVWMGRGKHGVTYRLRQGKLANFVGVVERDDWTQESWTELGRQDDALRDFEGWHPTITNLIKAVKPEALYRWALFDRAPLAQWTGGRATLLGDAAHPMLPFLAQGAAMAVEDSWVLAREISNTERPVDESLEAYQSLRLSRTRKTQLKSRANMKTFHHRTLAGQLATYGPMWLAGNLAPSLVHKRMDWIYSFDVTKVFT